MAPLINKGTIGVDIDIVNISNSLYFLELYYGAVDEKLIIYNYY